MSRRKSRGGGGRKGGMGQFAGLLGVIMGCVSILVCLICFDIAIGQLDTSYTTAAAYTDQVGLDEVMGIWGMILFVIFMAVGLSAVAGGAVYQWFKTTRGGWIDVFMGIIQGVVSIVIALILNDLIITQLHTSQVTVNATTNVASFSGLVSIQTIWGMVIFITIISAGVSSLIAAGYGSYKKLRGSF